VVAASFDAAAGAFALHFQDGSETCFDAESEQWFPFEPVETMEVYGSYGSLTVDKTTGAVLNRSDNADATDEDNYREIALIDVAELRSTLGEMPDMIDIALVGYTMRDGSREQPDRLPYIDTHLGDVNPTLAAFVRTELARKA